MCDRSQMNSYMRECLQKNSYRSETYIFVQYLVTSPRAAMTAAMRDGMLSYRLAQAAGVIPSHISCSFCFRLAMVRGRCLRSTFFMSPQTFSVGLRSRLLEGHGSVPMLRVASHW